MNAKLRFTAPYLLAGLVGLTVLPSLRAETSTIYVSPQGKDTWTGKLPAPNTAGSDGPVATPRRARDLVRELKKTGPATGPIRIELRGGTYYLDEAFTLTPVDSGTREAPVTWSAHGNERPVLSGGQRVVGWTRTTVNGHPAWTARLMAGDRPAAVRELWIDGIRLSRARWPRQGTLAVAGLNGKDGSGEWTAGVTEFRYQGQDVKAWPSATDGEAVVATRWVESRLPITAVDEASHTLRFGKKSVFRIDPGDRYWIENVKDCLADPGQFHLDPRTGTITLIPPAGLDPNVAQVVAPRLSQLLLLAGRPAAGQYVEHLRFQGLGFAHAEWYFDHAFVGQQDAASLADAEWKFQPDPARSGFNQAAVGVPGAVWGQGVRACSFEACGIEHVGTYGIELARGCRGNRISRCRLTDLGAGGIKIGEVSIRTAAADLTSDNEISDCRITNGGNLFPSCVAVWVGQSPANLITHNEIHGFWYTALSLGWTWGYSAASAQRNIVDSNHVHHIGVKRDGDQPILSDMAGIYTLGNHEGTIIRNNLFHDVAAIRYGGWGIYFDEGTSRIVAENNVVYRTTHGGFHQHYGKENTVRNNIFAFGRDAQIQRTRIEDHQSFRFERNIVYWERGPLFAGDWSRLNVSFDGNTYWRTEPGEIRFGPRTWDEWRKAGMDPHSRIADPHFEDPRKGNFKLGSAAHEALAGFTPIDLSKVGPR